MIGLNAKTEIDISIWGVVDKSLEIKYPLRRTMYVVRHEEKENL